jgi:hypothetical protein
MLSTILHSGSSGSKKIILLFVCSLAALPASSAPATWSGTQKVLYKVPATASGAVLSFVRAFQVGDGVYFLTDQRFSTNPLENYWLGGYISNAGVPSTIRTRIPVDYIPVCDVSSNGDLLVCSGNRTRRYDKTMADKWDPAGIEFTTYSMAMSLLPDQFGGAYVVGYGGPTQANQQIVMQHYSAFGQSLWGTRGYLAASANTFPPMLRCTAPITDNLGGMFYLIAKYSPSGPEVSIQKSANLTAKIPPPAPFEPGDVAGFVSDLKGGAYTSTADSTSAYVSRTNGLGQLIWGPVELAGASSPEIFGLIDGVMLFSLPHVWCLNLNGTVRFHLTNVAGAPASTPQRVVPDNHGGVYYLCKTAVLNETPRVHRITSNGKLPGSPGGYEITGSHYYNASLVSTGDGVMVVWVENNQKTLYGTWLPESQFTATAADSWEQYQ